MGKKRGRDLEGNDPQVADVDKMDEDGDDEVGPHARIGGGSC